MRPPNPRLSDNGSGPDFVDHYGLAFAQDDEGNPIRVVGDAPTNYRAVVQPNWATGGEGNGMEMSITTYTIMIYTSVDPGVKIEDRVDYRGFTLRALGDATPNSNGAWKFEAAERGPAPPVPVVI